MSRASIAVLVRDNKKKQRMAWQGERQCRALEIAASVATDRQNNYVYAKQ